jgi:transposase
MLRPDFKTIADFRKDNLKGLKGLFRQFVLLCKELDLFGAELIAIDGSKFKAVNSTNRNFTKAKLQRRLKAIDEQVEQYLKQLETSNQEESEVQPVTKEDLEQKIETLKERKGRYGELLKQMEERGDSQISLTDPDSRSMPKSPKVNVGYNVQVVVDDRHKLIVEQDVTNDVTDDDLLSPMAIKAKKALGVEHIQAVADMGYFHGKEVKICEEAGIEVYIPKPDTSANTKLGLFGTVQFTYDPEQDCYLCPAGEQLQFRFETTELGRRIRYYATAACRQCSMKSRCTRSKSGRRITRWIDEHILERMEERLKANPQIMKQRKQIVEHPFGTIKHANNQGYFLMKGLDKVQGEFSLSALVYNMKRVINILGVPRLMAALA